MLSVATFMKCQWQMNEYSYELLRKWCRHGKTEVPWEACPSATSSTTWTGPECSGWSDNGTVFTSSTTSVFSFHITLFSFLAGKRKRVEYVTGVYIIVWSELLFPMTQPLWKVCCPVCHIAPVNVVLSESKSVCTFEICGHCTPSQTLLFIKLACIFYF
jgi:hypothetical protein